MTVMRQLRDFAVAACLAVLIATVAFVVVRNTELASRQIELATRAAAAIADGKQLPDVHAVLVGAATPNPKRPYLRTRQVFESGGWRPLGAAHETDTAAARAAKADDKLFYDAANRFERAIATSPNARAGVRAELLPDGTGRAIAVIPAKPSTDDAAKPDVAPRARIAVAITTPARPAPYPWLAILGVLGLGAALAAAGALVGGRAVRAGLAIGIAALAIPCVLWQAWIASTAIVLVGVGVALAQHARLTDRFAAGLRAHRVALGFLAPAAVSMLVLVATPFIIGLLIGFYDHHHGTWTFVGLDNFGEILSGGGRPLDDPLNFWFIFGVTVLWTVVNVFLHVSIGVALALVLSRGWLRGKGLFRMLLILPWAIPNYITALIWKGMFNTEYGGINQILNAAGLDGVSWIGSFFTSFSANVITNTWLGFPFMMVVAIGALENIPKELYEAASVDGASPWQRFRHITLPHLRPALGPAVALGSIWTFNMFNVIHLVSGGQPGGATNILVTDAYRWAFERGERYGMAAAYATVIFLILLLWTVFGARIVKRKDDES
ncbi:MAG: carbohydrate ABC transporter permease [Kofleriaceae bacterium]